LAHAIRYWETIVFSATHTRPLKMGPRCLFQFMHNLNTLIDTIAAIDIAGAKNLRTAQYPPAGIASAGSLPLDADTQHYHRNVIECAIPFNQPTAPTETLSAGSVYLKYFFLIFLCNLKY